VRTRSSCATVGIPRNSTPYRDLADRGSARTHQESLSHWGVPSCGGSAARGRIPAPLPGTACAGPDRPSCCRRNGRPPTATGTPESLRRSRRTGWSTAASPWVCRSEGQPMQDDFRLASWPHQETLNFASANACVLVERAKPLGRMLRVGRITRAVAVSLLRVAPKRTTQCNGARAGVVTHLFGSPARPHLRGFSSHALSHSPYERGGGCGCLTRWKTSRAA
jgi:hypothetical protein